MYTYVCAYYTFVLFVLFELAIVFMCMILYFRYRVQFFHLSIHCCCVCMLLHWNEITKHCFIRLRATDIKRLLNFTFSHSGMCTCAHIHTHTHIIQLGMIYFCSMMFKLLVVHYLKDLFWILVHVPP